MLNSSYDSWLSLLLVVLFGGLLVLRIRYPKASRRAEIAALAFTAVSFFAICNGFF